MDYTTVFLQTVLGVFFLFSGWHKITDRRRHETFKATIAADLPKIGLERLVPAATTIIPWVELYSGTIAAMSIGYHLVGAEIVPQLVMLPMIGILTGALFCEGYGKVENYKPIDTADFIDDWLYLPETLMLLMAVAAVV